MPTLPMTKSSMTDVQRLVQDVRMLKAKDVITIVNDTPRLFSRHVEVIMSSDELSCHVALPRRQGLLCAFKGQTTTHVVSVFCCGDGRYLYYDPVPQKPYEAFGAFCRHNNIGERQVTVVRAAFQRQGFRTCAYHALTFLDYVTRLREKDSWLMIAAFRKYMGTNTDVKAISTVQDILWEFPNDISLSLSETPGGNPVYVPPPPTFLTTSSSPNTSSSPSTKASPSTKPSLPTKTSLPPKPSPPPKASLPHRGSQPRKPRGKKAAAH